MKQRRHHGFTLVEVLVALAIMAVLAGLAWRGLDGMMRSRDAGRSAIERTARLNTILAQWQQDLGNVFDSGAVPALSFDGQTLRVTRTVDAGVVLVAWSLRGDQWQRWVSPPVTRQADLQEAWLRSQQLLGNESGQVKLLEGVSDWQVYFFRGNTWSNAQSTGDLAQAPAGAASGVPAREALPQGVRLVLGLPGGALTRDIALGPHGA